jgi:flagellin
LAVGYLSNINSLRAQRRLNENTRGLSEAYERLSSGLRINRASDDAAGLAVSSTLNSRSRVYGQALRNINDGISALAIADGATDQLTNIVVRLKELATSSSNGTYARVQRLELDREASSLTREWNRIVATTSFNGRNLLDTSNGELGIQLGYGTDGRIGFTLGGGISRQQGTDSYTQSDTDNTLSSTPGDSVSGDFNGDGNLDFVSLQNNQVRLYVGDGRGNIAFASSIAVAASLQQIAAGDLNQDGIDDVVVTNNTTVTSCLGSSSGTFGSGVSVGAGVGIRGVVIADFDNDGKNDISYSSSTQVVTRIGNGDGIFRSGTAFAFTGPSPSLNTGDFNGDGRLDLSVGAAGSALSIYTGNGSGGFGFWSSTTFSGTISTNLNAVAVGDINHDGLSDIAALTSAGAEIRLGSSGGNFTTINYSGAGALLDLFLTDMNGDGDLDLVGGTIDGSYGAMVGFGHGDGTFDTMTGKAAGGGDTDYLTLGDFNKDGVMDYVTGTLSTFTFALALQGATQTATIQRFDLNSVQASRSTLTLLDQLLERITKEKGIIGSNQSRMLSALNTVSAARENYQAASSRLADADVASETARLTRLQILQQAGSAVLAQANQAPALALTLLR